MGSPARPHPAGATLTPMGLPGDSDAEPSPSESEGVGEPAAPDPTSPTPSGSDGPAPPPARRGLGAVGRTVLLGIGVIAAFFVGLAAVAMFGGDDPGGEPAPVGDASGLATQPPAASRAQRGDAPDTLPEATLKGFGDQPPVGIADYAGQPLVVNFWATWCAPCVEEMPDLQRVHEQVGDQVTFLGVNVRDAPSNAEPFVDELGITYDLAADPDGDYYREIGAMGMPTTLLVTPDGRIAARETGALTAAELRELLADELGVQP